MLPVSLSFHSWELAELMIMSTSVGAKREVAVKASLREPGRVMLAWGGIHWGGGVSEEQVE